MSFFQLHTPSYCATVAVNSDFTIICGEFHSFLATPVIPGWSSILPHGFVFWVESVFCSSFLCSVWDPGLLTLARMLGVQSYINIKYQSCPWPKLVKQPTITNGHAAGPAEATNHNQRPRLRRCEAGVQKISTSKDATLETSVETKSPR